MKMPEIKFNHGSALCQLISKGFVFTIRHQDAHRNCTHRTTSKVKLPQYLQAVIVRHKRDIEVSEVLTVEPSDALDEYVKNSGFVSVDLWLEALNSFGYKLPKTFSVYFVTARKEYYVEKGILKYYPWQYIPEKPKP